MDHGSTEWKDELLEVILAMSTQIHSTIGCAPAELLFRDRSSHIDWLNSQARKDLTIGIEQEDPTMDLIFESELQPELELESETEALIDPQLRRKESSELSSLALIPSQSQSWILSPGAGPGPECQLNLGLSFRLHLIL